MTNVLPEPTRLVRRDIREAAALLTDEQARYLVDYYYAIQDFRIQAGNQVRAAKAVAAEASDSTESGQRAEWGEGVDPEWSEQAAHEERTVSDERADDDESTGMFEPHAILSYTFDTMNVLEGTIQKALDDYSTLQDLGRWAKSITGIGPVLAAGLLAHIDIEKAPTAGHIWSFAGLNPEAVWLPKTKRPWNAKLKTLCWKIGESFVKVQANEKDVYGKVYAQRKAQEWERNIAGIFSDQAARSLEEKNFKPGTDAHTWYSGMLSAASAITILELPAAQRMGAVKRLAGEPGSGVAMLPPARIHLRSTRYAVKLFLAHYQHVAWELKYDEPPVKPYVIEHGGHVHFIGPPNWPMQA